MVRGDIVQYWFDTGAFGAQILRGQVIKSGPKSYTVKWESGLCNRLSQDDNRVKLAKDQTKDWKD